MWLKLIILLIEVAAGDVFYQCKVPANYLSFLRACINLFQLNHQ
jgi:hypothetical protein